LLVKQKVLAKHVNKKLIIFEYVADKFDLKSLEITKSELLRTINNNTNQKKA